MGTSRGRSGVLGYLRNAIGRYADPAWWRTRVAHRVVGDGYYGRLRPNYGVDIMGEDWDVLVLLDACRRDTMAAYAPDDWPAVDAVESRGGNTWDFYSRNFDNDPYLDTVVVTANPRTTILRADAFHDVVPVYEDDWDDELGTVRPAVMADRTIEVCERYPDKRVLAHWLQPHQPFLVGDIGRGFEDESVWKELRRGGIDLERVVEAYEGSLKLTIPEIERVAEGVTGRVVVSADHGNLLGESPWFYPLPMYGHPRGVRHPALVEVPWVVFDDGEQRPVTVATERRMPDEDGPTDETVQDRLRDLGYV